MTKPSEQQPVRSEPSLSEAQRWAGHVRNLPDLRWNKVVQARRTLRLDTYETNRVLEAVLAPLANELGVLCRRGERVRPA